MPIIKNKSRFLTVVIAFTTALLVAGALNVNTDNQSVFAKKRSNQTTQPKEFYSISLLDNPAKYSLKMGILQHLVTTLLFHST